MGSLQAVTTVNRTLEAAARVPAIGGTCRVRVPGLGGAPETVWAERQGSDEELFEVTSLPFVTPNLAYGDLIAAFQNADGGHELVMVVKESPYSVFSVIATDAHAVQADLAAAFSHLDGALVETNGVLGAVGCLPDDYDEISDYLERGERAGRWCYAAIADRLPIDAGFPLDATDIDPDMDSVDWGAAAAGG